MAPRITVKAVEAFERDVRLRLPFRFGVVTLREAPQAFLRAYVERPDGRGEWGNAAELMIPKWFDKSPDRSNEENVDQLRRSVRSACRIQLDHIGAATAADLAWSLDAEQRRCLADESGLVAGYGPALVVRAVLDGLCRLEGASFYEAIRTNRVGLGPEHLPADLAGFDVGRFLSGLRAGESIEARHTVGLVDPLTEAEVTAPLDDGLPESLEAVVARYGHRYFKLKVSGDAAADLDRLAAIAAVLDRGGDYRVTLDGNEQFSDVDALADFLGRLASDRRLTQLVDAILYVEQPLHRASALERPLGALAERFAFIVDESDADFDAFRQAKALGYRGISSKTCKGLYRSIVNAARCRHWSEGSDQFFLSGEDLTTQAGLAVQQDLALVSLLGLDHVERNGHHYVDGMAGATAAEMDRFAQAHPDLYRRDATGLHLKISEGRIATASLGCVGYATAVEPDYAAMRPMT
ncbi:MAG TPA: enolase C-terminal domain-like protein [Alphaproteobacteria bacterium]|nr:enolase C-terminal domain-like protein [Alphaproteobacteria bacterium]